MITKGSGTHDIDTHTYAVEPGYIFLMRPGQVHVWKLSADIDGYTIFHTKEFYNQNFTHDRIGQFLFFQAGNFPLIILSGITREKIELLFQYIITEYESERKMRLQKICSLSDVLYIELSDVYVQQKRQRNPTDNQQEKISQLEDLIDRNYKSLKFPKEYAELMNMSQKHLNRIVKLNLNKTISALISDRVVLEAKRMLLHSSSSISQIAFELGYIENGYFFRLFKNKTGQTPTEFLNEFNKN
jgi:AraC-like DNA-binding protein